MQVSWCENCCRPINRAEAGRRPPIEVKCPSSCLQALSLPTTDLCQGCLLSWLMRAGELARALHPPDWGREEVTCREEEQLLAVTEAC